MCDIEFWHLYLNISKIINLNQVIIVKIKLKTFQDTFHLAFFIFKQSNFHFSKIFILK